MMIEAMSNRGQEDYAAEWLKEYMRQNIEMQLQLQILQMQAIMIGLGQGGAGAGASGSGSGSNQSVAPSLPASAVPQQVLGMPQTPASPQAGPINRPQQPRPGAWGAPRAA